jgi:transposase
MKKHSAQFKLSVVEHYLSGTDGYKAVAYSHGIGYSLVKRWVTFYRYHGMNGLTKKTAPPYTPEFKLSVLRYMWDNRLSYAETAAKFNIRAQSCLGVWERSFLKDGMDSLIPPPQGTHKTMSDSKTDTPPPTAPPSDDARPREELIAELKHLRMEVAYLKKLKALVQAKQLAAAPTKRK